MAEQTQNFNLTRDSGSDYYSINTINANLDKIDTALGNTAKFEKAGGTGTNIALTGIELVDGRSKTFIASSDNNGAATAINGKSLYKPGSTKVPIIKGGKAYTIWYSAIDDCFFLKASAEGDAGASDVLAGKTFSNDDDTGIIGTMPSNGPSSAETISLTDQNEEYVIAKGYHSGLRKIKAVISGLVASVIKAGVTVGGILGTFTSDATAAASHILDGKTAYINGNKVIGSMPNNGAASHALPINGSYTIPAGYHNGSGKVTQSIPTKAAATYTPGTTNQSIPAGQYLSGNQTILGDSELVSGNIRSGVNIFGVTGSATVVDTSAGDATAGDILYGKKAYVDGTLVTGSMPNNGSKTFTPGDSTQSSGAGYYSGITVNPRPALSGNAAASQVLSGQSFYSNSYTKQTGSMPNQGSVSHSLPINGSYTIPAGYHNGSGKITQSVTTRGAATITPGTTNQTIAAGQYLTGAQTIKGDANLIAANIKSGVSIFGVAGSVVPGRRYASGTAPVTGSKSFIDIGDITRDLSGIQVSGLTFEPSVIIAYLPGFTYQSVYTNDLGLGDDIGISNVIKCFAARGGCQLETTTYTIKADTSPAYVNSTGFCIPIPGVMSAGMQTFYWIAFE